MAVTNAFLESKSNESFVARPMARSVAKSIPKSVTVLSIALLSLLCSPLLCSPSVGIKFRMESSHSGNSGDYDLAGMIKGLDQARDEYVAKNSDGNKTIYKYVCLPGIWIKKRQADHVQNGAPKKYVYALETELGISESTRQNTSGIFISVVDHAKLMFKNNVKNTAVGDLVKNNLGGGKLGKGAAIVGKTVSYVGETATSVIHTAMEVTHTSYELTCNVDNYMPYLSTEKGGVEYRFYRDEAKSEQWLVQNGIDNGRMAMLELGGKDNNVIVLGKEAEDLLQEV
jgi:hypothetical protein